MDSLYFIMSTTHGTDIIQWDEQQQYFMPFITGIQSASNAKHMCKLLNDDHYKRVQERA